MENRHFNSLGYEILIEPSRIQLAARKTYTLFIFTLVFAGVLFICFLNVLIQFFIDPKAAAIIGIFTILVGLIFFFIFTAYRNRKNRHISEVPTRYSIDLNSGKLFDKNDEEIAAMDQVSFDASYNYFKRSYDLKIILPSNRCLTIYSAYCMTSFKSDHVIEVKNLLEDLFKKADFGKRLAHQIS